MQLEQKGNFFKLLIFLLAHKQIFAGIYNSKFTLK